MVLVSQRAGKDLRPKSRAEGKYHQALKQKNFAQNSRCVEGLFKLTAQIARQRQKHVDCHLSAREAKGKLTRIPDLGSHWFWLPSGKEEELVAK